MKNKDVKKQLRKLDIKSKSRFEDLNFTSFDYSLNFNKKKRNYFKLIPLATSVAIIAVLSAHFINPKTPEELNCLSQTQSTVEITTPSGDDSLSEGEESVNEPSLIANVLVNQVIIPLDIIVSIPLVEVVEISLFFAERYLTITYDEVVINQYQALTFSYQIKEDLPNLIEINIDDDAFELNLTTNQNTIEVELKKL